MIRPRLLRSAGLAGALALVLAPAVAEAQAAAAACPDAATVQAARLVEFQTMMMGVAVRCRHVGVPISDHLDGMNSARRTMFASSHERVSTYLRSLNTKFGAATGAPPPPAPAATAAAPAKKLLPGSKAPAGKTLASKAPAGKPTAFRRAGGKAALTAKASATANDNASPQDVAAATPAPRSAAIGKGRKAALGVVAAAEPAAPAKPAAKLSRRTDPYDRYLTMIGNQYGGGITTLQRCKAFDAIVLSLGDKTNTDRLLTMVSSSLVQATLLEAIVNCPAEKK
ncbi:hypothetical protein NSE01_22600 [Novosphingobium sediminis]|uniref:Uncharacterized protein n=1 Tax=Novosphingobium sediminis TaxID=707214 RepID=A0A512AL60_9SPHN|nr:hypothetical protein [Novosphingobium sediminis]GEO00428.1 hypothetical protein NSE01_22600 [Novosphingobium sediminis]